jgi:hypothetical protein
VRRMMRAARGGRGKRVEYEASKAIEQRKVEYILELAAIGGWKPSSFLGNYHSPINNSESIPERGYEN